MSLRLRSSVLASFSLAVGLLSGCGISGNPTSTAVTASASKVVLGHAHGGQQPIGGGTVQLYAASLTTLKGAATPLGSPATTAADGSFTISGFDSCPVGDALVYIVGTGGNPGLAGNVNNSGIAMMSLIGTCSNLLANANTTYIWIDELTTVVAVQALAPFMSDATHVGSAPSGLNGVGSAFATATDEINFSTGQFNFSSNISLPFVTLNTLADIIAACTNTDGGSGPCPTLFSNTGGSSNTVTAALYMVQNPAANTTTLYNLISSTSPFQPYFNSVPSDFTTTIGYQLPAAIGSIQGGVLDSTGQIWLALGGYNYDPGTNTSTASPGYINVYNNSFQLVHTINSGSGGLYYPTSFTADARGHVFALNANNTISEFNSDGSVVSPTAGWPTGQPSTFTGVGTGNVYPYNASSGPIAADSLGNIWGVQDSSATSCYFELNATGGLITQTNTSFCTATNNELLGLVVNGSGNAWGLGENAIAKTDSTGALVVTAPTSQGCFSPGSMGGASTYSTTDSLLYDHAHNQLWGYSLTGAGAITDAGVAVFCDFGPTVLPVVAPTQTATATPGVAFSGNGKVIISAVLDGAGNLWFTTGGASATGVAGSSNNTFTGTVTYSTYLGEISSSGTLMTPYNAANGTYGLQPAGLGANGTAAATNTPFNLTEPSGTLLGVDNSGNIWAVDTQTFRVLKIMNLAAANSVNY